MRKILATSAVLFCFIASTEQSNAISASEMMNDLGDKITGFLRRAPKASSPTQEQDISHINLSSRSSVDLERFDSLKGTIGGRIFFHSITPMMVLEQNLLEIENDKLPSLPSSLKARQFLSSGIFIMDALAQDALEIENDKLPSAPPSVSTKKLLSCGIFIVGIRGEANKNGSLSGSSSLASSSSLSSSSSFSSDFQASFVCKSGEEDRLVPANVNNTLKNDFNDTGFLKYANYKILRDEVCRRMRADHWRKHPYPGIKHILSQASIRVSNVAEGYKILFTPNQ